MKLVKLRYTEPLIRSAVWSFWRRAAGWRYFLAMALLLASIIYSVAHGDRSWWVSVSATVLCLAIIIAIALYFVHYRGAITEIWQFPDYWLLFFSRAQFITLPLADLDPEAQELILDRAKSHGAKVS